MDEFETLLGIDIALKAGTIARNSAMPENIKEMNWIANGLNATYQKQAEGRKAWRTLGFFIPLSLMGAIAVSGGILIIPIILIVFIMWCVFEIRANRRIWRRASEEAYQIMNEKEMKKNVINEAMYQAAAQRLQIQ